jgi:two-component system, NtrC family, nitrogen regulation response regulator NtrX
MKSSGVESSGLVGRILIIDDEPGIVSVLSGVLTDEGHTVFSAPTASAGMRKLQKELPDICFLDVWLPDADGVELLEKIRSTGVDSSVIMMSGHANVETAVRATRLGALDFIEKPLSLEKLIISVQNALRLRQLKSENQNLRNRFEERYRLIGNSAALSAIRETIQLVSARSSTVLITGENGTGKENVARTLHENSSRAKKPLVAINCAAIPEDLIESELFGYEKGAFTGANASKRGKFEQAHTGTLFLDEIGDMSLRTQSKVLRVLQEQKFERIGGDTTIDVDIRFIAATNKNLEEEIRKSNFREDLFYRLNVIPIKIPPLRERREDIMDLAKHYLTLFCLENGIKAKSFSEQAVELLKAYSWPGNIRELKNIMERISIMVREETVSRDHLTFLAGGLAKDTQQNSTDRYLQLPNFRDARAAFERDYIQYWLDTSGGSVTKASEAVGMERSHLYRKLKQLGIDFKAESLEQKAEG